MRRFIRELTLAAALLGAAAIVRGDTMVEAARRAGIVVQTAAIGNDVAIVIGSDSTTGQGAVAVFRRGPDGAWSLERREAICGTGNAGEASSPASAPPAAAPAAEAAPPPPARPASAPAIEAPVAFPPPHGVSDGLARQIHDELRRRARQSAGGGEKAARNGEYLKTLAGDLGWIDIRRFGVEAACDAARIAVASGDRALLAAAMPWMEKDLRNSEEGHGCYEEAEKAYREAERK